jgi:hypothetical protein
MQMTAEELMRFERRWKAVSFVFGIVFIAALIDHMTHRPHGWEAFGCYAIGGIGFLGCFYAGKKLRDPSRIGAALEGLTLFDEDISIDAGDLPD